MPFYNYFCDNCENPHEDFCSVSEYKTRKKCPNCKKNTLYRIYGEGYSSVQGEPRTLGALADRNSSKYKKGEHTLLEAERKRRMDALKKPLPKGFPEGSERMYVEPTPKSEIKKMKKLANMTPQQKHKYITKGEGL